MTTFEIWQLVLGGFAAIGTVGAVILSLWLSFRKKPYFQIRDIQLLFERRVSGNGTLEEVGNFIIVKLENRMDAPMHVMQVGFDFGSKKPPKVATFRSGFSVGLDKIFIPAHSQYDVTAQLPSNEEAISYGSGRTVTCRVTTNFGEKSKPLPEDWQARLFEELSNK
jgi:hypothetical protein